MITNNVNNGTRFRLFSVLLITTALPLFADTSSYAQKPNLDTLLVHVVNPISDVKILPTTFPLPGTPTTTLRVSACRGEYEPASFVLFPVNRDIQQLKFITNDLTSDDGDVFKKDNIDLRIVKVWYQAGGGWNRIGLSHRGHDKVLVPELLLKNDNLVRLDHKHKENLIQLRFPSGEKFVSISRPSTLRGRIVRSVSEFPVRDELELQPITLPRREARQFWITVHVPISTPSGNYRGEIVLVEGDNHIGKLDLHIQVFPFELQAPNIQYSIYYRGRLSENATISSEYKGETQFTAELRNMIAHGVTNPTVYQRLNKEELKRIFKIREQVGVDKDSLFYLGTGTGNPQDEKGLKNLHRRIKAVREIASEYGIKNTYIYGLDEARGKKLLSQRKAWDLVSQLDAKVFVAGHSGTPAIVRDLLDLLIMAGKPKLSVAAEVHRKGHKIFSYANPQTGPENPELFRRNYGLELWKNYYDGAMPYAYQDSMGFIWNDFDHERFRDHNFTYPTVAGVIDTLAWEGFREGIDDVRYIATLEKALTTAVNSPHSAARKAFQFLRNLRNERLTNLNKIRSEVVFHILQVRAINNSITPSPPKGVIAN